MWRTLLLFFFAGALSSLNAQVDPSSVTDKVICGYQGWFNCYGDGSAVDSWRHWVNGMYQSNTPNPSPGNVQFEVYPDVSEYEADDLFLTSLGNLGNGRPAELFSSYPESVIQLHFEWMETHGIDGVALQRFIAETYDGLFKENRDTIAARVRRAAEATGRMFYMMYDLSGLPADEYDYLKSDWNNTLIGGLDITASAAYAHQNGKPVIALWGLGFTHLDGNAAQALDLIEWFQSNGYYVIGGVPTYWRTGVGDSKPDFEEVYKAFDMLSPWTVGRYVNEAQADEYKDNELLPDRDFCGDNGIDYQPVLFPGTAWSNWNGGPPNQTPRNKGSFFWRQAHNIRQLNIPGAYIAMFDEYDEATSIAPGADSYFDVPTDQYFLTYSADGAYRSSDFYLRLAGEITQLIKEEIPFTASYSTSPSEGPVYFRTSFEDDYDAMPDWESTVEETTLLTNVSGTGPGGGPLCRPESGLGHYGETSLLLEGVDDSDQLSFGYFKVFDLDIPISPSTYLRFRMQPGNENGRHISLDLILTDGTNLRDVGATDVNGVPMHPGTGRGTVGEWTPVVCHIGNWLAGKTIDRIVMAYDNNAETGSFSARIDDIELIDENVLTNASIVNFGVASPLFSLSPNPATEGRVVVRLNQPVTSSSTHVFVYQLDGRLIQHKTALDSSAEILLENLPGGVYFVGIEREGRMAWQKLIVP
jgi:hypothetical protein